MKYLWVLYFDFKPTPLLRIMSTFWSLSLIFWIKLMITSNKKKKKSVLSRFYQKKKNQIAKNYITDI